MTDNNIYNALLLSSELEKSIGSASEESIRAAEHMAKEIVFKNIPSVGLDSQENIDLIVRPLAMVILANEMMLESMFAETSIIGILESDRLPDIIKSKMLKVFASSNGISTTGESPSDIYSQIVFSLNNRNSNLASTLERISRDNSFIDSMIVMDSSYSEMERNKLSYIQLESSVAMHFTRSKINNGTLLDGGYSRKDRLVRDEFEKSERIVIPGSVDVAFSTGIEQVEISIEKSDDTYSLPKGYYIDVAIKSEKQFAVIVDDAMEHGIVNLNPVIFVEDGSGVEVFLVSRFLDPDFEGEVDNKEIEVFDVLYKGKYPLLIDLKVYSARPYSEELILGIIEDYLVVNSRDISLISPSEIMEELKRNRIDVSISSTNNASLFFAIGKSMEQSITFPLTEKDITIPDEITTSMVTRRTISAHIRSVQVEVE